MKHNERVQLVPSLAKVIVYVTTASMNMSQLCHEHHTRVGQPRQANGSRADENQVSRTSSSCTSLKSLWPSRLLAISMACERDGATSQTASCNRAAVLMDREERDSPRPHEYTCILYAAERQLTCTCVELLSISL